MVNISETRSTISLPMTPCSSLPVLTSPSSSQIGTISSWKWTGSTTPRSKWTPRPSISSPLWATSTPQQPARSPADTAGHDQSGHSASRWLRPDPQGHEMGNAEDQGNACKDGKITYLQQKIFKELLREN